MNVVAPLPGCQAIEMLDNCIICFSAKKSVILPLCYLFSILNKRFSTPPPLPPSQQTKELEAYVKRNPLPPDRAPKNYWKKAARTLRYCRDNKLLSNKWGGRKVQFFLLFQAGQENHTRKIFPVMAVDGIREVRCFSTSTKMSTYTSVEIICLSDIYFPVYETKDEVNNPVIIALIIFPRGVGGGAVILREVRDKWIAAALFGDVRE